MKTDLSRDFLKKYSSAFFLAKNKEAARVFLFLSRGKKKIL